MKYHIVKIKRYIEKCSTSKYEMNNQYFKNFTSFCLIFYFVRIYFVIIFSFRTKIKFDKIVVQLEKMKSTNFFIEKQLFFDLQIWNTCSNNKNFVRKYFYINVNDEFFINFSNSTLKIKNNFFLTHFDFVNYSNNYIIIFIYLLYATIHLHVLIN